MHFYQLYRQADRSTDSTSSGQPGETTKGRPLVVTGQHDRIFVQEKFFIEFKIALFYHQNPFKKAILIDFNGQKYTIYKIYI